MVESRCHLSALLFPIVKIINSIEENGWFRNDVLVLVAHLGGNLDAFNGALSKSCQVSVVSEVSSMDHRLIEWIRRAQGDRATRVRMEKNRKKNKSLSIVRKELVRNNPRGVKASIINPEFPRE